ncbi:hypothetical protein [Cryobacterium cheniae]|uniref:hypothetical protein n=1 Tax=Cryobacterium cheniae TaxID=1259262 RepID=UPI00141BA6E0|nr:hypothetical protein [Cryobacterium cheniae]
MDDSAIGALLVLVLVLVLVPVLVPVSPSKTQLPLNGKVWPEDSPRLVFRR